MTDAEFIALQQRFIANSPCACEHEWRKSESVVVRMCRRCVLIAAHKEHVEVTA